MDFGTFPLSEAVTATQLDKENHENVIFSYCSFKQNTENNKWPKHSIKLFAAKVSVVEASDLRLKNQQENTEGWESKRLFFSLVLFRSKYDGVPPILKTAILIHLKKIGHCCTIFLRTRCIPCIRNSHHCKFKERH